MSTPTYAVPAQATLTTGLLDLAERIATNCHRGQLDQAGFDYIDHPRRVAAMLHTAGPITQAAGWLHDVLAMSSITLTDLGAQGIPTVITRAVDAVTHRPGESEHHYYATLRANRIALQVKLADLRDRTHPRRLVLLDEDVQLEVRRHCARAFKEILRP